jgi:nicotinate-nucleotide adenylyltransferase
VSRTPKVGLFGGTFDPIHNGHLRLARAALRRHQLDSILFIPSGVPPHKSGRGISPFLHRYAMVALACTGEERFVPSLLEAGADLTGRKRFYSVETVAKVRRQLGSTAKLFFLLGADQFLTLPSWKGFPRLAKMCEFIVAARPGFTLEEARSVVSPKQGTFHLLRGLKNEVSSSEVRQLVRAGQSRWKSQVPAAVAEYIEETGLYRSSAGKGRKRS